MRLKLQRLLHESANYDSRALLRSVRLYLPYISPTSPPYLPYISSARCALPACNPVCPRCNPASSGCNRTSSGCNPSCRGCASRHPACRGRLQVREVPAALPDHSVLMARQVCARSRTCMHLHMHHAPCTMHHAPCIMMDHAPCTVHRAPCTVHHACACTRRGCIARHSRSWSTRVATCPRRAATAAPTRARPASGSSTCSRCSTSSGRRPPAGPSRAQPSRAGPSTPRVRAPPTRRRGAPRATPSRLGWG